MKKIVIWGTGEAGKKAYKNIAKYSHRYYVSYWGDSDLSKVGNTMYGIPIIGVDSLKQKNIDYIVIASMYTEEIIELFTNNNIKTKILENYNELEEMPYEKIFIEISGKCNAKCEWCVTGRNNRYNIPYKSSFMSYDKFKEIYYYLMDKKIINDETVIALYDWGEPFLNPDFQNIIKFLTKHKNKFELSTNASRTQIFENNISLENLNTLVFSMSGFSQSSYDKIHGFNFLKIKNNIQTILDNFKKNGFNRDSVIVYHVYQFNKKEINDAKNFARKIGSEFIAYNAYFNGMNMALSYLENTMPYDELKLAGKELDLFYIDDLISKRPKNYYCPEYSTLTINEDGNVVLCCVADKNSEDYKLDNILNLSLSEIKKMKNEYKNKAGCIRCKKSGLDYWTHNVYRYDFC